MNSLEFLRQFRFAGYAIFDIAVSFGGIYLLSSFLTKIFVKFKIFVPKNNWVFLTLPIGILVHILFNTMTPMTVNFLDLYSNYILKIIIIGFLVLGLRNTKIIK